MVVGRGFMLKVSFKFRVSLLTAAITGVACILLISMAAISSRKALENQVRDQLLAQGKSIKSAVVNHQQYLSMFAEQLADSRLIEGMFMAYESVFYTARLSQGSDQDIYSSYFEALNKKYYDRSKKLAKDFDFSDIILVDNLGQAIFAITNSKTDNVYLGKHIESGVFKDSLMRKCYTDAKNSKDLKYSGFEVNSITKEPVAYLCQTKVAEFEHESDGIAKGDKLGVIIMKIDLDKINSVVKNVFGMGQTGVAFLVDSDGSLRSDYKNELRSLTLKETLNAKLKLQSESIEKAAKNEEALVINKNHFGETVFSYYSNFKFFDENMSVIVEKDQGEVFAPVNQMIWVLVGLGSLVFLVLGGFGFVYIIKMISPLQRITEQMTGSAGSVAKASEVLSESSVALTQGAQSAASSLEETVASLEEISSMIATNSDNAEESYRISSKNADSASQGSQKISALISTMRNVATSASKIEEITVVIDDIAFQTNLLALNAAVEAARAGEQGKGFAVVADAVRSLAQKSAQSTKEINELIKEMVDISTKGSELADESGQVLDEIVKSIKQTSELTKMISEASKEQSVGIKQVTEAMNTIDRITQGNADTSNQVSENSGQMAGQAETLKDVAQELSMLIHGKNAAADKAA